MRRPGATSARCSTPSSPTVVDGFALTGTSGAAELLGAAATVALSCGVASPLGCGAAFEHATVSDNGSTTRQAAADMKLGHGTCPARTARNRANHPNLKGSWSMKCARTIGGNRCVFRNAFYLRNGCP